MLSCPSLSPSLTIRHTLPKHLGRVISVGWRVIGLFLRLEMLINYLDPLMHHSKADIGGCYIISLLKKWCPSTRGSRHCRIWGGLQGLGRVRICGLNPVCGDAFSCFESVTTRSQWSHLFIAARLAPAI